MTWIPWIIRIPRHDPGQDDRRWDNGGRSWGDSETEKDGEDRGSRRPACRPTRRDRRCGFMPPPSNPWVTTAWRRSAPHIFERHIAYTLPLHSSTNSWSTAKQIDPFVPGNAFAGDHDGRDCTRRGAREPVAVSEVLRREPDRPAVSRSRLSRNEFTSIASRSYTAPTKCPPECVRGHFPDMLSVARPKDPSPAGRPAANPLSDKMSRARPTLTAPGPASGLRATPAGGSRLDTHPPICYRIPDPVPPAVSARREGSARRPGDLGPKGSGSAIDHQITVRLLDGGS